MSEDPVEFVDTVIEFEGQYYTVDQLKIIIVQYIGEECGE